MQQLKEHLLNDSTEYCYYLLGTGLTLPAERQYLESTNQFQHSENPLIIGIE